VRVELLLGNVAPVEVLTKDEAKKRGLKLADLDKHDDEKVRVKHPIPKEQDDVVTHVVFPEGVGIAEGFTNVTHQEGTWRYHSDKAPSWVSSDVPEFATLLKAHFESGPYDGNEVRVVAWKDAPTVVRADGEEA
jgi:hypothetical protein